MSDDYNKIEEIFRTADINSGYVPKPREYSTEKVKMSSPKKEKMSKSENVSSSAKKEVATSKPAGVKKSKISVSKPVSQSYSNVSPYQAASEQKASAKRAGRTKVKTSTAVQGSVSSAKRAANDKKSQAKTVSADTTGISGSKYDRQYMPIRQNRDYKSGLVGGILYFIFILCVSIIFATMAWMAVSDVLALNNDNFTAVVELPESIFKTVEVDKFDDDGNLIGIKHITEADMSYVSVALKDAGLIKYSGLFELFGKISHGEQKIDPGSYELKSSYDYRALIKNMQEGAGATLTATVTIPEGFTMREIFLKLEENGICKYDALMDAAANYSFNYDFINPDEVGQATRLEGFLFPDTYEFYVGMDASGAINKFLENFNNKQTEEIIAKVTQSGYSMRDVVNMASLIEKEAANNDERSVIASVIFNRIKANMPLGLECSLLYLHPDHEGAPTAEMYAEESPYNLMKVTGLPPTPVCNPGLASIYAVLNPATTTYYYYSLDTESGTHRFFNDYNDFNNFVATQDYS